MIECLHHAGVPAAEICLRCSRPYCHSCLIEFMGVRTCGECKDRFIQQQSAKPPPEQPRRVGFVGFWLTVGMVPTFFAAVLVAGLASESSHRLHKIGEVIGTVVAMLTFVFFIIGTTLSAVGVIQRDRRRGFALAGMVIGTIVLLLFGVMGIVQLPLRQ